MEKKRKPRTRSNGEGSIYARPDGRWCAALSVGWTATGNPRRKMFYGATREEVRKKLTAAIRERDQGGGAAPGTWTVGKWVEEYQKRHAESVRESTAALERRLTDKWILPSIGRRSLTKLQPSDVSAWQRELLGHMGPHSANLVRVYLGSALKAAMREGLVSRNVVSLVPRLKEERRQHTIWDEAQARAFLDSIKGGAGLNACSPSPWCSACAAASCSASSSPTSAETQSTSRGNATTGAPCP